MTAAAKPRGPVNALLCAEVGLATVAVATTALVYGDLFATKGHLLPLLATTAAAAVLATVAALPRLRTSLTFLLAVAGFVVVAVYAVLTPTLRNGIPTLDTLGTLRSGVLHGWQRMLSVGLPADVSGDLLLTPALVLFAAAFTSVSVALRTRALLAPVAAPVLSLVVALLFTAARSTDRLLLTGVLLLVVLALVLIRAVRLDTVNVVSTSGAGTASAGGSAQRTLFGLPVVLVVAVVGVLLAEVVPLATGQDRFDPRDVVTVPVEVEDTLTPLATIKSQLQEKKPRELFTVRVDGNPVGDRLDRVRTAALDSYDGALWTSTDRFLAAGHTLAADPSLTTASRVKLHVEIRQLDHPYLPAVGWPEQVTAGGVGFSADSGVLAAGVRARDNLGYDLVGALRPRDGKARLALPNLTPDTKRYTTVPADLPPTLSQVAAQTMASASEPYAKLVALEKRLRTSPYDLSARPGHSLDALRRLFGPDPKASAGHAEQYASAFAVLARSQGFPARVATGYLLRPEAREGETYTVRSIDAYAWAEVNMTGYGWMAFDPTDPKRKPADKPESEKPEPGRDRAPDPAEASGNNAVADPATAGGGGGPSALDWTLIILGALVALAIFLPVLIALEKWRRRRGRRVGPPSRQIIGAWHNSTDQLLETGMAVPRSLTALEVAGRAQSRFGESAAAVAVLAPLVTEAVFSPEEPQPEAVAQAWQADTALRQALRRERGVAATVVGWFDPRPITTSWRQDRQDRRNLRKLKGD